MQASLKNFYVGSVLQCDFLFVFALELILMLCCSTLDIVMGSRSQRCTEFTWISASSPLFLILKEVERKLLLCSDIKTAGQMFGSSFHVWFDSSHS